MVQRICDKGVQCRHIGIRCGGLSGRVQLPPLSTAKGKGVFDALSKAMMEVMKETRIAPKALCQHKKDEWVECSDCIIYWSRISLICSPVVQLSSAAAVVLVLPLLPFISSGKCSKAF